ncbi:MAG: hypothetical protein AB8H86_29860 [Polyangiales bacterium]
MRRVPTLALTHRGIDAAALGAGLRQHDVIAAAGFMCAPQAHETLGTSTGGVLRLSVGPGTTEEQLAHAERALHEVFRG